jgi:uncharacterized DUF497 family protein
MNLKVEWSEPKAKLNYAKHGVSFDLAKEVFNDPFAIEFLDDRQDYGEERLVMMGMVEGRLFYVVYTERADAIRLISARRATKNEQETYFKENS